MAASTLVQRIALDGGEEIRKELQALGTDGEAAFRKLQTAAQSVKLDQALTSNIGQIQKSLTSLGTAFTDVGKKLEGIGRQFSTFVTLPIAAAAAEATKAFTEFDAALAEVATHVDTTVESISKIGDQIREVTRSAPVDLADVAKGLAEIRKAGIDASSSFDVLNNSAKLAVASQTTVADASRIVTAAIAAFNLKGADQAKVFDLLFRASENGKFTLTELGDSFGKIGATVQASKVPLDEYLAALAAISRTGLGVTAAQRDLNTALQTLAKNSKDVTDVMDKLNVTGFAQLEAKSGGLAQAFKALIGATGDNEAALVKLFGSVQAYAAVLDIVKGQNGAFTESLAGMRSGVSALDPAFQKIDQDAASAFKNIRNEFNDVLITIGQDITPAIITVGKFLGDLSEGFAKLPEPVRNTIEVVAGIAAVIGPALLAIGAAAVVVGAGFTALAAAGPTLAVVGAVLAGIAVQAALLVGAFKALQAALAFISQNQNDAAKAAGTHANSMKDLQSAIQGVKDGVPGAVTQLKGLADAARAAAANQVELAKQTVAAKQATLDAAKAALAAGQTGPGTVNRAAQDLKIAQAALDAVNKAAAETTKLLDGGVAEALSSVKENAVAVGNAVQAVAEKSTATVTILRGNASKGKDVVGSFAKQVVSVTNEAASGANNAAHALDGMGTSAKGALIPITGLKDQIATAATGVFRITDDTGKVLVDVRKDATDVGKAIADVGQSVKDLGATSSELKTASTIVGVADAANEVVIALQASATQAKSTADAIVASGQQAIQGWAAVPQAISDAATAAAGAVQQIVSAFNTVGEQIGQAFASIAPAISAAFAGIVSGVQEQFSALESATQSFVASVSAELAQLQSAVASAQAQLASAQAGGSGGQFAGGGQIRGPGSGTSDSIWAKVSNGEWVIKSAAVRFYGPELFAALNAMRMPSPGFAMGGLVHSMTAPFRSPPAFAAGGPVSVAGGTTSGGRPIHLTIDGQSFGGLSAPEETATKLDRFITGKRTRSSGRRPNWYAS